MTHYDLTRKIQASASRNLRARKRKYWKSADKSKFARNFFSSNHNRENEVDFLYIQKSVKLQELKLHFETKVFNSHLEETPTY